MDHSLPIIGALFGTLVAAAFFVRARRLFRLRAQVQETQAANRELQALMISCLDEVGKLLADESLAPAEVAAATALVFARMRAASPGDGGIEALVADTEGYVAKELAKRG